MSTTNAVPRFPGRSVDLGGRTLVVPALSIAQAKDLSPAIQKIRETGHSLSAESIGQITDVVVAAIQRNYPDITREEIEGLLDLGNFAVLFRAALGRRDDNASAPAEAITVSSDNSAAQ